MASESNPPQIDPVSQEIEGTLFGKIRQLIEVAPILPFAILVYLTSIALPPREVLEAKLHEAIAVAQHRLTRLKDEL